MFYQKRNKCYRVWSCIFVVGFLLGIICMNSCKNLFLTEEGIWNQTALRRLQYVEVDYGAYFPYVLKTRISEFLFIGILSTTVMGIAAVYLCIAWKGMLAGMMCAAAFIRFGIKGFLLILAGFFPQQLLLLPAGVMMLYWCYENCSTMYFPAKSLLPSVRNRKGQYLRKGGLLLWIMAVVMIGCILECYVNPLLVTDIVKIF